MNLLDMRTAVAGLAGDESFAQFTAVQIDMYINWGQGEVARRLELLQQVQTATSLDSGSLSGGLAMSVDFDQELFVLWANQRLTRMDYATYLNGFDGVLSTDAAAYYTLQNTSQATGLRRMLFFPYQTLGRTGLNITVVYQGAPITLVGTTDVCMLPVPCHEAVVLYALARCKLQENDMQGYQMIMRDFDTRCMQLSTLNEESDAFSYAVVRADYDNSWPVTLDG